MPKIILTRGIQGSGKSTWAKKWVEEDPTHRVRWNNDDFNKMLGYKWLPEKAGFIADTRLDFLMNAMQRGFDIVVDNMNMDSKHLKSIERLAQDFNETLAPSDSKDSYTVETKDFFDVPLEECIERDSRRETPIGKEVITETYNRYKELIENSKSNRTT